VEFRYYLIRLRAWMLVLVGGGLLSAAGGYLVALQIPPIYESRATLLVNVSPAGGIPTYSDITVSQQLVKTYAVMAVQPVVLGPVAQQLGLQLNAQALERAVTVQPVRDTQLLTVVARWSRAEQTRDLANTVAAVFTDQQNQRMALGGQPGVISLVQPALLPEQPTEPRIPVLLALFAAVGVVMTVGVLLVWDYLDDRVKTPEQLHRAAALPALGAVMRLSPNVGVQPPALLISPRPAYSPANEAYRLVRTNLDLASLDQPWRSLLVTSAQIGEGKSTTAANLALVLAHAGRQVIAVDTDLRSAGLHRLFGLENGRGLGDLLVDSGVNRLPAAVDGYLQPGPMTNLRVLTSGSTPPNPTELLQSSTFLCVLDQLMQRADVVVLDGPSTLGSADALVLAQAADATLLVVDTQRARATVICHAVAALRQTGTHLVGGVLNRRGRGEPVVFSPALTS